MLLTLPIYVEVRRQEGRPVHHCRPLLFAGPQAADAHLGLAMSKLNKRLKQHLDHLGSLRRHDDLATCAFAPELETHLLKPTLELRERQVPCKLLWVVFEALRRRIAFPPALPDLWCEIPPGRRLEDRAREVLERYFRDQERLARKSGAGVRPESIALEGQAWITTVDVEVKTRQAAEKELERKLAALFDDARLDGGVELQRVGRCLDWLYPDELHRAVAREQEVAQLDRLLSDADNRPIVLVGPRLSGKTTVLHECVRRRVARRKKLYASRRNVWLLSPQRLISGMMFVGQWEGRVQAILREARRRRHVLYFDDFLGLYQAGISRDASLSVADVLKPPILRREIRVLAELTAEAWQAFQEHDRGLADQFHVLRIEATGEEQTRRVMLEVHRQLEAEHRAAFGIEALPTVLQLHGSYIRDAAFPGKSAAFSRQLAQKYTGMPITRQEVNQEFHLKTGLSPHLIDDRQRLERSWVVERLRAKIVGQDEAVQAAADVVAVAKARLADPGRPLATLLFLGPTGVGKTQCAKALAEVMFSDAGRLLRFDMNEYVSPHSAAQLVGTFGEPDGLLTAAVRRQPFAVVLLDEIEKAHPDVFDLLLQVTGEGRLTDALGRTADFSNIVVVMTSNLGTTAGQESIGLAPPGAARRHTYVQAAENFFRPEFFNRIDRVIPFESLSREEMRRIADLLLADVFQRDGLVRRRCALAVEPQAMERIVDAGYHPQFGARALKRAIERQLVQPVAASLAGVKPELPAVIRVYPHAAGITASVRPLESVPQVDNRRFAELEPSDQLNRVRRFIERMEDELEAARPSSSGSSGISPEQIRYYALKEQLHRLGEMADGIADVVGDGRRNSGQPEISPKTPSEKLLIRGIHRAIPERRLLRDIQAAQDIHDYLRDSVTPAQRPEELPARLAALVQEAALLYSLQTSVGRPDRVLLTVHSLVASEFSVAERLRVMLKCLFGDLGFACEDHRHGWAGVETKGLRLSGPGIWPLATAEAGVHIFCRRHENLLPVQVAIWAECETAIAGELESLQERRRVWLAQLAAGKAEADEDPWPLGSILRFYDEGGATLDLRTGQSIPRFPSRLEWKMLLLAGLPLPSELET